MSELLLPVIEVFDGHERFAGCLPRKSKPGEWCPMASDRIEIVPESQWAELAKNITLRPRVRAIKDQNGFGACASYASVLAVEIAREIAGYPYVELNPLPLYALVNGGRDAGSSIDENLRVIMERGVIPAELWPESNGWRKRPPQELWDAAQEFRIEEFYDISSKAEFVSALLRGFAVVFGAKGHALCSVAYKDTHPEVGNSWNTTWGDQGFGKWVPWNGINWGYGGWCGRVTAPSGIS